MISLHLHFDIQGNGIPDHLIGDEKRLLQIFNALLENAAKFNNNIPEATLSISLKSRTNSLITILFALKDNGIGIEKKDFGKVFK